MFKIVYVLTSNGDDVYYKQLIISLRSLRLHMESAEVIVVVDENTYENIKNKNEVTLYAKIKKEFVGNQYSPKEKSRYLKTVLRDILDGDLLYIDTDTIICKSFLDYYNYAPLALVFDENVSWNKNFHKDITMRTNKRLHFSVEGYYNYYNGGVIWMRDLPETRKFFKLWHQYWIDELKYGDCLDQPPLNHVNEKVMPLISQLPYGFNLQITAYPSGIQYLDNVYIIHYLNSSESAYILSDKNFIEEHYDSMLMENIIRNPKCAFREASIIASDSYLGEFLKTYFFKVVFCIYKICPMLFKETVENFLRTLYLYKINISRIIANW